MRVKSCCDSKAKEAADVGLSLADIKKVEGTYRIESLHWPSTVRIIVLHHRWSSEVPTVMLYYDPPLLEPLNLRLHKNNRFFKTSEQVHMVVK